MECPLLSVEGKVNLTNRILMPQLLYFLHNAPMVIPLKIFRIVNTIFLSLFWKDRPQNQTRTSTKTQRLWWVGFAKLMAVVPGSTAATPYWHFWVCRRLREQDSMFCTDSNAPYCWQRTYFNGSGGSGLCKAA